MRRLVLSIIVAPGLVMVGAGSASAAPAATAGRKVCRVSDARLNELSGLVATKKGFVAINDGSLNESSRRIYYLNDACKVTKQVPYGGDGPRDPEDMVLSKDGKTLWIADIGDNNKDRQTIGVWKMPIDGSKNPVLHRLAYPDGDGPYDAEALLLDGDGTPIIVTKALDKARIYVPTAPLKANRSAGVPLRLAGEVVVPPSTTPTGLPFARGVVTGGAVAPGGTRVALRTYSDALEWDVANGDVLAALKGRPRVTPLPDEQQGEAIAYSADGRSFLTVNDMQGVTNDDNPNNILRYTPTAQLNALAAGAAGRTTAATVAGPSFFDRLSLKDITYLVGAVGVLGALLVGAGIFGIVRARRRPQAVPAATKTPTAPPPDDRDAQTALIEPVRDVADPLVRPVAAGAGQRPGVYGSNASAAPATPVAPGVYGATPAATAHKGSGVYGGATAGRSGQGSVYGAQPAHPPAMQPAHPPAMQPSSHLPGPPPGRTPGTPQGRPPAMPGAPAGRPQNAPGPQSGRPPALQGPQSTRPSGPPAGGQPERVQGGQSGRVQGGQSGRVQGGQPGRPPGAQAGPPVRPGHGTVSGAPAVPPLVARPPGRPQGAPAGAQSVRAPAPPPGGAPGRPPGVPQDGQPVRPQGPPAGYAPGVPPARPQQSPSGRPGGAPSGRPSGFFGAARGRADAGRPAPDRQAEPDAEADRQGALGPDGYDDVSRSRRAGRHDTSGYEGRTPRSH